MNVQNRNMKRFLAKLVLLLPIFVFLLYLTQPMVARSKAERSVGRSNLKILGIDLVAYLEKFKKKGMKAYFPPLTDKRIFTNKVPSVDIFF